MSDRRHAAIHEAGQAVIGRVLCLLCGGVSIDVDKAGHAIIAEPWATATAWDAELKRQVRLGICEPKARLTRSAFRGTIIARMAGTEAEILILGTHRGRGGFDRTEIDRWVQLPETGIAESIWPHYSSRARRQTLRLVRKHRTAIVRVANALLERGYLSGEEVSELMG